MLHLGTPRPGAGQERATKTRTQVLLDWSRRFEALGAAAKRTIGTLLPELAALLAAAEGAMR